MWAAPQPTPWPLNTISTSNRRRFSTSIHYRQGKQEVTTGPGVSVFTVALESKAQQTQYTAKSQPPPQEGEESEERQLSGNDILIALQKATAQKAKKQKVKRDIFEARKNGGKVNSKGILDFSNVRTLCIKPEWSVQLEEFERRLEELIDS